MNVRANGIYIAFSLILRSQRENFEYINNKNCHASDDATDACVSSDVVNFVDKIMLFC